MSGVLQDEWCAGWCLADALGVAVDSTWRIDGETMRRRPEERPVVATTSRRDESCWKVFLNDT
jgi:hypothetical protein